MEPNYIRQEYPNQSINKDRNINSKDIHHISRFTLNKNNVRLNIFPHSLSHNKKTQNTPSNYLMPRMIQNDNIKNFYNFYEKENSKKSESTHNISLNNNNFIEIKDLIGKNYNKPIDLKMLLEPITKFNQGKISSKSFGIIKSYAANTNQGIVRNYNEDRVSIIINMNKPNTYKSPLPWPKISYFAIFDGHAGNKCAEYLRENLLKLICSNIYFPENIPEAIKYGFEKADEQFLNNYAMVNGQLRDNSGTCGLILLIINDEAYIGNVGDSRCIGSFKNGKIQRDITRDHKPNSPYERERIISNGGQIYQTKNHIKVQENFILKNKILLGPYRVFPGRLSVSRTVGDAEGKIPILGGNPNVIICKPDIYKFNLNESDIDYFILGCDGIFDQLRNEDVFKCSSLIIERNKEILNNKINKDEYKSLYGNNIDIHSTSGDIVDLILKAAMIRQSYDNVTCLLICFKNLLDIDFQYMREESFDDKTNQTEIYSSIKREPKILVTSNSTDDYLLSSNINKKNINIHGIKKLIKKISTGNSESSLIKKKEEMGITNEANEYSGKPLMNIIMKNFNKNEKENSFLNVHPSQSNSNINISLEHNNSINDSENNHTLNYKEEKRSIFANNKNNNKENNHCLQVIYKNINKNTFLYNPKNTIKSNNNTSSNIEKEESENKKNTTFYKKKINYIKKRNEIINSINNIEKSHRETEKDNDNNLLNNNSRYFQTNKTKKNLNINSFICSNKYSFKIEDLYNANKNETLNNKLDSNNLNRNFSSSIKKNYEKEENNKNNQKYNIKIDLNNKEKLTYSINNNFLTETKIKSNKVFHNIIKNKTNKINLFKNFDKIKKESSTTNLNNTIKHIEYFKDKNINKNTINQTFKSYKPIGIRKIYPSPKNILNEKEKKSNNIEYNNHKYYYSNNKTYVSSKDPKYFIIKNKYVTYNYNNNSNIKNNESRFTNTKNLNEIKSNYSSSQIRSNTEYNNLDNNN